jgi:hypothetical protein
MTQIFISYSRVDKRVTKSLTELLSRSYDDVWYDTARIVGGENWWAKILERIDVCDYFIFLLSPDSLNSEWCQKELTHAQNSKKRIIPVRIRDRTDIPDNLKGIQCIDMVDELSAEGLNQIYAALIRYSNDGLDSLQNVNKKLIEHYMLFWWRGLNDWGRDDWEAAIEYVAKFQPTCGFWSHEAAMANKVTIVGSTHGIKESVEKYLENAGCQIERLDGCFAEHTAALLRHRVEINTAFLGGLHRRGYGQ